MSSVVMIRTTTHFIPTWIPSSQRWGSEEETQRWREKRLCLTARTQIWKIQILKCQVPIMLMIIWDLDNQWKKDLKISKCRLRRSRRVNSLSAITRVQTKLTLDSVKMKIGMILRLLILMLNGRKLRKSRQRKRRKGKLMQRTQRKSQIWRKMSHLQNRENRSLARSRRSKWRKYQNLKMNKKVVPSPLKNSRKKGRRNKALRVTLVTKKRNQTVMKVIRAQSMERRWRSKSKLRSRDIMIKIDLPPPHHLVDPT